MSAILENMGPDNNLLSLGAASLRFGQQGFGPFDFQVEKGERIAVLGPSGAGKSTLLKLMAGELQPRHGRVCLRNRPLSAWTISDLSRQRAVLPQSSDVAFGLSSDLVVGLGRVARSFDPQLHEIVREAAELACASHLLGRYIDTLSGGEKARIQLARIFAQLWDVQEGLILIDEPLAALDPGLQFDLLKSIDLFATQRCHAVIAILHDINQAMQGFDRLLLIKDGRLTADIASAAEAVPALEALYQINLSAVKNAHGDLIVIPARSLLRRAG